MIHVPFDGETNPYVSEKGNLQRYVQIHFIISGVNLQHQNHFYKKVVYCGCLLFLATIFSISRGKKWQRTIYG